MSKKVTTTKEIIHYCGEMLALKVISLQKEGKLVDTSVPSIIESLADGFSYDVERFSNAKTRPKQ